MCRAWVVSSVLLSLAAGNAAFGQQSSWKLTREGVELRRNGAVVLIALPGWQWAGPPHGRALALAAGPLGEVLVTSDVLPVLWRIDMRSLAVSVHPLALDAERGKEVGFSALVYARAAGAYFARGATDGACWRVDASLRLARKLRRGERIPLAAAGICMQE